MCLCGVVCACVVCCRCDVWGGGVVVCVRSHAEPQAAQVLFCSMFGGPDPREDRGRGGGRGGQAPRVVGRGGWGPRGPRWKWSTHHGGQGTDDPGYGHNTANRNAWSLDRSRHHAPNLPATGLLVEPSDRLRATADAANEATRQQFLTQEAANNTNSNIGKF